jgi:NADPH:quinone reductase-like Zn-dependent oxidoreductase
MNAVPLVPKTMRAVLLTGHGGTEQLVLRNDVPVPVPGLGEVLVRVRAAALNNTDINTRIGWYSRSVRSGTDAGGAAESRASDSGWAGNAVSFPLIQGADACGEIVHVGPVVDTGRLGERVLIDPVLRGPSGAPLYFGSDVPGAFAEFTVVPARNACAVHSALSDIELASFPCAYLAAENMLTRAAVAANERVLVTGAAGGVGSAAVQLARRRGAQVIGVAEPSKWPALAALGVQRLLPRDCDLVVELAREPLHVVIDVVGGARFAQLLAILMHGGRYAVAGAVAGPRVELDLRTLYLKDLRLLGCTLPEPGVFASLIAYIERGEIRPLISATYPLSEIATAQARFLERSHVGKIVLTL